MFITCRASNLVPADKLKIQSSNITTIFIIFILLLPSDSTEAALTSSIIQKALTH